MERIRIKYAVITRFARKVERMNLQKVGRSLGWISMMEYVTIHAREPNSDVVLVDKNWRDQFREFLK